MTDHHKFRYLLPPGNNFAFVAKFKIWLIVLDPAHGRRDRHPCSSTRRVRGEYMNWTIDFKGGTEIIFAFKDKATGTYAKVDPAQGPRGAREGRRGRLRGLRHLVHGTDAKGDESPSTA